MQMGLAPKDSPGPTPYPDCHAKEKFSCSATQTRALTLAELKLTVGPRRNA
jgi:hypothetical protein